MEIIRQGTCNIRDRANVQCTYCGSRIRFWRGEPNTEIEENPYELDLWDIDYKCPVCETNQRGVIGIFNGIIGLEKEVKMTLKEKESYDKLWNHEDEGSE